MYSKITAINSANHPIIKERAETFAASAGTFQVLFNLISCVKQHNVNPQHKVIKRKSLLNQPSEAKTVVNVYKGKYLR